jgi:gliding motility associated protien GldN
MQIIRMAWAIGFICTLLNAFAQDDLTQLPWQQRDRQDMVSLAYEYQREADVMWSKNIWRVIDTRQKLNKPFVWPQQPLIKIIHEAAMRGEIEVYDPTVINADQFKLVMDTNKVRRIGVRDDTTTATDVFNPDIEVSQIMHDDLSWDKITKYRLKEVWFFDTKTSSMQVRIIGIAPVMEYYDASGNYVGDMVMYWVNYASLRNMLAKHEVFNPQNDSQHYSWEDLFEMRMFASYIYKESNVYDRNIQEYASGVDAQLESERIKNELFIKEHDMWNY